MCSAGVLSDDTNHSPWCVPLRISVASFAKVSLDLDATMYSTDIPALDIPLSPPYCSDSPLLPSSSQSSDNSVDICDQEASLRTRQDIYNADRMGDSPSHPRHVSPPHDLTSPTFLPLTFLPSGSNTDSMGWPPIESALLAEKESAQPGYETSIQVSEVPSRILVDG